MNPDLVNIVVSFLRFARLDSYRKYLGLSGYHLHTPGQDHFLSVVDNKMEVFMEYSERTKPVGIYNMKLKMA